MGAWAFGAGMGGAGGGGADPILNFQPSNPQSRPIPFSAPGQPGNGRMMAPQQPVPYQPIMPVGQQQGMAGRMAPGQPNMQGSYVPAMQGMPQLPQLASQTVAQPLQNKAAVSQSGAAQVQLGSNNPNSTPGGRPVSWHPVSLGEITRQTNELLQHGTVKGLLENNTYFQKLYSNLPDDMKVGLLKSAALVGQPSNSQIDAQSMYPSRQIPGQRTDLVGQQPAISSNNMTGLRSPSIVGGMAQPLPAISTNMSPQTQAMTSGLSTQPGADAGSYTGISTTALDFIKGQEGFSSKAYKDYKQYSIGYGTQASSPNATITKEQAQQALLDHANQDAAFINKVVTVPLTQNQLDALTSFTYNVGRGAFQNSSVLKYLNQGDFKSAAAAMLKYNKAGGNINQTLVNRRQSEYNMFLGGNQ